jgi:hypothetical protein
MSESPPSLGSKRHFAVFTKQGMISKEAIMAEYRGWKRIESETVVLNREKGREFAGRHNGLPQSPTERELNPDRVKKLKEAIAEGRAIPFNWALVRFVGKDYRMNGQHSSRAIMEFDGDLPDGLSVHLDKFQADTKQGMADLFRQFDARWSSRSKTDVSGAFQGLQEQVASCDRKKAQLAVEGVAWYRRNIEKVPVKSGDEVYDLFFEESLHSFVNWIDETLSVKTPEMKKSAITGAMYGTFITSESGAREFWDKVAMNNVADDSAPSAVLSAELVKSKEDKVPLAPGICYAKCVKAWNAFREGEKIHSLNVNTKKGLPEIAA